MENKLSLDINFFENILNTEWEDDAVISDVFKIETIELDDADTSKGIESKTAIIKRILDNKYFEFKYSSTHDMPLRTPGLGNLNPIIGNEVFPHQVTVTVFKKHP